jgi:signal transduction histidine kinase
LTDNSKIIHSDISTHQPVRTLDEVMADFAREKAELIEKLKNATKSADEYHRLKTTFIANVSHEMRTPLNAILGFSELSQFGDVTLDEMKEYMKIIHKSSEQLLDTVKDVIFISNLDADEIDTDENAISVRSLFQDLQEYYSYFGEEKFTRNIQLLFRQYDEDLVFTSDLEKISQIFRKLLDNAFKFTQKGSVEVGYQVPDEKTIRFYVKDTGIGIPSDKLDLIFEPFRCVDESHSREFGGSGLGLSIVMRLVKLLGGKVQVDSELGKGTTMSFTINYKPVVSNDFYQ